MQQESSVSIRHDKSTDSFTRHDKSLNYHPRTWPSLLLAGDLRELSVTLTVHLLRPIEF